MFFDFLGFSNKGDGLMQVILFLKSKYYTLTLNNNAIVLVNKEIEIIEKILKANFHIFLHINGQAKNVYRTFMSDVEGRMKLVGDDFVLKMFLSYVFVWIRPVVRFKITD